MNKQATGVRVTLSVGSAEYCAEDASMNIDRLIEILEDAKAEGATEIVGLSGNYRGAGYNRFSVAIDYVGEDVEDYDDDL